MAPRVRWDHLPLEHAGEVIGRASSVTWSPTTERLIAFGLVSIESAVPGTELQVEWSDYWGRPLGKARVVTRELPFIELKRR